MSLKNFQKALNGITQKISSIPSPGREGGERKSTDFIKWGRREAVRLIRQIFWW